MMKNGCPKMRPLLALVVEGEGSPAETLRVARHVADCTVCRILLARERRLGRALDQLSDAMSVDDRFLESVMRALPEGPPPVTSRDNCRRGRHGGLRLAGLGGLVALGGAISVRTAQLLAGGGPDLLPRLANPQAEGLAARLAEIGGAVVLVLDRIGAAGALVDLPALHAQAVLGLAAGALTVVALAVSTAVAVAAHSFSRG